MSASSASVSLSSSRAGRLRACCGRCVLGSPAVAASWCALLDLTLVLFGRGLPACLLGAVGLLAALEALLGAARGSRAALWWYALYSAANVAVSAVLGIVVLAGVDVDCVGATNRDACALTESVTGILLLCVLHVVPCGRHLSGAATARWRLELRARKRNELRYNGG